MATITLELPENLANRIEEIGDQLALVLEMGLSRLAPVSTQSYMEIMALLSQTPAPQAILDFRFSAEIENRIGELLAKNRASTLSQAEDVELDRLCQLEEQLQLLKSKALISLQK